MHKKISGKYVVVFFWKTLLLLAGVFFSILSYGQEEKKVVPDGTDGTVLTVPETDSLTGKATNLPPNEVNSPFSTDQPAAPTWRDLCPP